VGNFYYDLGIQVITVCYRTRARTGGLIDLQELTQLLRDHRGKRAAPISECVGPTDAWGMCRPR
jgi:ESCRT-II complex subunit VPS22